MLSLSTFNTTNPAFQLELSESNRLLSYACVIGSVLYVYDYSLTLDREIELIWKRKFTLPTLLYIFLRYSTFFGIIFTIGSFFPHEYKLSCSALIVIAGTIALCIIFTIDAIISLRIVALYNRNKCMIVLLASLNILQMILLIYSQVIGSDVKFLIKNEKSQCELDNNIVSAVYIILSWIPLAIETSLLGLTMCRIYWLRRRISTVLPPFLQLIARDGMIYYVVICMIYIMNILNHTYNIDALKIFGAYLGVSLLVLTTCRLTLNLQYLGHYTSSVTSGYYDTAGQRADRGLFTTRPSRFRFTPVDVASWLTGERWGMLEGVLPAQTMGNSVVEHVISEIPH